MHCTLYYTYRACRAEGYRYLHIYFNAACRLSRTCDWVSTSFSDLIKMPTSSSILASAMSVSLPFPPAIFCASLIWFLTAYSDISHSFDFHFMMFAPTSALKSSNA
jgi:hypothetical protein